MSVEQLNGYMAATEAQLSGKLIEFSPLQQSVISGLVKGALFEGFRAGQANPDVNLSIEQISAVGPGEDS